MQSLAETKSRNSVGTNPPPSQILRLDEVIALTRLSRSTLRRLILAGRFPKPLRLTEYSNGWLAGEVLAFIEARAAERDST